MEREISRDDLLNTLGVPGQAMASGTFLRRLAGLASKRGSSMMVESCDCTAASREEAEGLPALLSFSESRHSLLSMARKGSVVPAGQLFDAFYFYF